MNNSKGYIFLEMLVAFSMCCFIAVSIVPVVQSVALDRHNTEMRTSAYHVLYEKLAAYSVGELSATNGVLEWEGVTYSLSWRADSEFPGMVEGCVSYETGAKQIETLCDSTK